MKILASFILFVLAILSIPAEAKTVCTIGDSVIKKGQAWRGDMQMLRPEFVYVGNYFDDLYLHDGIGGDKATDVIARLDTINGCDVALVHVGGNDLANGATGLQIVNRLTIIADNLIAKGMIVWIDTILPCNDGCGTTWNLAIANVNYQIKTKMTAYNINDVWSAFMDSGYGGLLYVDHFHPSALGYSVLANYTAPKL